MICHGGQESPVAEEAELARSRNVRDTLDPCMGLEKYHGNSPLCIKYNWVIVQRERWDCTSREIPLPLFSLITINQPSDKLLRKVINAVHSEFVKNTDNLKQFLLANSCSLKWNSYVNWNCFSALKVLHTLYTLKLSLFSTHVNNNDVALKLSPLEF